MKNNKKKNDIAPFILASSHRVWRVLSTEIGSSETWGQECIWLQELYVYHVKMKNKKRYGSRARLIHTRVLTSSATYLHTNTKMCNRDAIYIYHRINIYT